MYSIPAGLTIGFLFNLIIYVLLLEVVPAALLWILVTVFGLVFYAVFCVAVLLILIVVPLVGFLLLWLVVLSGSLFVWFPVAAIFLSVFKLI